MPEAVADELRIIDGHVDAPSVIARKRAAGVTASLASHGEGAFDLDRARASGVHGAFLTLFAGDGDEYSPIEPAAASKALSAQVAVISEATMTDDLRLATRPEHLAMSPASGEILGILHMEGAEAVGGNTPLDWWVQLGLRSLGIVWSRPNRYGWGVPFGDGVPDTGPGLTADGRQLVGECNAAGVLIDMAHLNEKGFWDVARLSKHPLVVTHAAAHALTPTTRNLTDDQLRAIRDSGGVVGLTLHVGDLRPDGRDDCDAQMEHVVAHALHLLAVAGADHVALGSDLDGARIPSSVADVCGLPRVFDALTAAGVPGETLRAIASGNWERVLTDTWSV